MEHMSLLVSSPHPHKYIHEMVGVNLLEVSQVSSITGARCFPILSLFFVNKSTSV